MPESSHAVLEVFPIERTPLVTVDAQAGTVEVAGRIDGFRVCAEMYGCLASVVVFWQD